MRIPYAPSTASENPSASDETTAIYERIAARRKPRPLIPLDLALLHAPPIADGWNHLLGAIRTQTVLVSWFGGFVLGVLGVLVY
jgi:hypothetical protein